MDAAEVTAGGDKSEAAGTEESGDCPKSPSGLPVTAQEQHQSLAALFRITDPPDTAVVREIAASESKALSDACLVGAGWPISEDASLTVDQPEASNRAQYVCAAS